MSRKQQDRQGNKRWFDAKCKNETEKRNTLRMIGLHSLIDKDKREYKEQKSKVRNRNRKKTEQNMKIKLKNRIKEKRMEIVLDKQKRELNRKSYVKNK